MSFMPYGIQLLRKPFQGFKGYDDFKNLNLKNPMERCNMKQILKQTFSIAF
jgi:hypothetical protein